MTAKRAQLGSMDDATLGLEDAAKVMRLGVESMKELVENGTVPAVRLNQKHTVLLREDLINYLREEGRRQAAARREAVGDRPAANTPVEVQAPRPTKTRRTKLPDLAPYEVKG